MGGRRWLTSTSKGLKGRPLSTDLDADPGDLFFWMSQQDAITNALEAARVVANQDSPLLLYRIMDGTNVGFATCGFCQGEGEHADDCTLQALREALARRERGDA